MKPKDSCSNAAARTSRRRFAKGIVASAALAAAPLASSVSSNAQTPPAPKQSPAPPNPQPTPNAATPPPPPSPVAEAYTAVARARFGAQVTDEEMSRIARDLEGNVRSAERLRAVKLNNSDEPDFIFSADQEGKEATGKRQK